MSRTDVRRLAHAMAVASFGGVTVVWVAAKVDFFRRYDPTNLSGYLAGHWPFWAAMIVLAGLGYGLAHFAGDPSEHTKGNAP